MATGGYGAGPNDLGPVTLHANDMDQARAMIAELQKIQPDARIEALHVKSRLIEAGIEVVVEGGGLYAQIVLDPNVDPQVTFHIIEHLPDAVESAVEEMLKAATERNGG
jgi:hypothetical protein